jgi:DNA-binding GntR family transcriptional regulator
VNDHLDAFEPVERETTASIIADRIRDRIMDGSIAPGMQLGEAQLSERLGVSRGPIREAMQRLIQEGLLRNERHRGVFVVELNDEDVEDIYLARRAIEGASLAILARRQDGEVFALLESIIDSMEAAAVGGRWTEVAQHDLRFHEAAVAATGSKRLIRMFRTLLAETRICLVGLEANYGVWQDLVLEHRALLDGLRRGEQAGVLGLLDQHFNSAVRALRHSAEPLDSSAL